MRVYLLTLTLVALLEAAALSFGPFRWLNIVGLVGCTVGLYLHVVTALNGRMTLVEQGRLARRFLVFLLGGCICPKCGQGHVKFGSYTPCMTCRDCGTFFFVREAPSPKAMWSSVWRPRR